MKRHGFLWEPLISFPWLLKAALRARRGKRFRPATAAFECEREKELWRLHHELATKTYRPGAYHTFHIHEPKKRLISAAPYRDRVVHHALVGILEPIFERSFIADSYACRKGKGTHAPVERAEVESPGCRPVPVPTGVGPKEGLARQVWQAAKARRPAGPFAFVTDRLRCGPGKTKLRGAPFEQRGPPRFAQPNRFTRSTTTTRRSA